MITIPKMLRLLLATIAAMMTVTCIAGFPAAVPMHHTDQLLEMHKAYEGNRKIQRILEELIGLIMMNYDTTGGGGAVHGAAGGAPTSATDADNQASQTCSGRILSNDHVQDIQYQKSNLQYIVVNGEVIARENPLDLYIELFRMVRQSPESTDIWFSHVPCVACIEFLDIIFDPLTVKPILHVESLQYNGSSYTTLRDLGCLAKLRTKNYQLKTWDWDLFSARHDSCNYYSTSKYNTEYVKQKIYTSKLTAFLEGNFTKSSLAALCDPHY